MSDVGVHPILVSVSAIRPDPRNPRRINERQFEALRRAIREDPNFMQMRPILVREDDHTIYAGNMRFEAAKAEGWTEVPAIITDDPEPLVRKRAVRDNTQFGEWVDEELGDYLHALAELDPDFNVGDLGLDDKTLEQAGLTVEVDLSAITPGMMPTDEPPDGVAGLSAADTTKPEPASSIDPGREEAILKALASVGYDGEEADPLMGIPLLLDDTVVQDVPHDIATWGGPDTEVGAPAYFYNYSPAGTWRDVPMDKCFIAFYTDDRFLERWWANPAYYVARLKKVGVLGAVEMDLSTYTEMPWVMKAWQLFRSRWLSRFMQDAGIPLIPAVGYPTPGQHTPGQPGHGPIDLREVGTLKEAPVMSYNAQTGGDKRDERKHAEGVNWFFSEAGHRCDVLIAYGARGWGQMEPYLNLPSEMKVIEMPTFLDRRKELGLPWRAN
jgi:hypothetical protein